MQTLTVELGDRSYPIFIGKNLLSNRELLAPYIHGQQVLVVTNSTIAPLYLDQVCETLSDFQVDTVVLPDGEKFKNLDTLNLIYDAALENRHNRKSTFIALGGGVIGDMTGYAAASYQRGVNFIQIPTTLLSQVDSSVGGKTGINHALGKNMIGAFWQPQVVIADTQTLNTLPDRELSAGIAEVIKYGLLGDKPFLDWLEPNMDKLLAREPAALAKAIYQSCQDKADIVAQDEREGGVRALLNLGHTFGHAIENAMGYGEWLHGEAVAAGMVMAADMSQRLGWISQADAEKAAELIAAGNLPTLPPASMSEADFLNAMAVDKKNIDGTIRLILLTALGKSVNTNDYSSAALKATINELLGQAQQV